MTLVVFITLAILFAYMFFDSAGGRKDQTVPYTTFISYVEANQVAQVEIKEQSQVHFVLRNGSVPRRGFHTLTNHCSPP